MPDRHAPERPAAVEYDARPVVTAGTALFAVAFVVLLPFWSWLGSHDHRDWLWTALTGALLGLAGRLLMVKHRREGRTR